MNSSLVRTSLVVSCLSSLAFVTACTASTSESERPGAKSDDVVSSESALGRGKKAESKACPIAIRCSLGYEGVDTDGDDCLDTCQPAKK